MCGAETVKDAYNQCCDQWAEYRKASPVNQCVVDFAGLLQPGAKVLDVGCGTGYPIAAYLAGRGFRVTGIDISERMIEKARALALPGAEFLVGDVLRFQTAERYDAVIAFDSLWHIAWERQRDIYGVISSLLSPGGYFLFTHGKRNGTIVGEMFGKSFYYSALDTAEVRQMLAQNGFTVISSAEDYHERTTGDRDLIVVARKLLNDGARQ